VKTINQEKAIKFQLRQCLLTIFVLFAVNLLLLDSAQAQIRPYTPRSFSTVPPDPDGAEFYFARLIYGTGNFRGRGGWTVDMPEAEHYFMNGITRLTEVDGSLVNMSNMEGSQLINLEDRNIFDYPFLYAVEVGGWSLNTEEIAILREYLLKGGFLIVDDFHGSYEWSGFMATMQRIFPDRPVVDIPHDDEVFQVVYQLDPTIQIPGISPLSRGVTWERDGRDPTYRGIYDDRGRLMVAINHNMDLGDAWEHADTPGYPQSLTAMAYRFAVNYVIYSLTH
tara:strand:- start:37297 stop:38136 length:840 start_codon:yes stop_codon:yes gene_type:complete